ncbi:MAG: DUF3185 family protein [Bacteroidetes bacterium]|jgi:hypothetical protein|nr:DUF3185 family protein [Bacteroidota bacterium]
MKKIISTIFLVGGLILLYFGYQEYQSFASEMKEMFTGTPSSEAKWMIIGGAAAAIAGLTGLLRK